MQVLVNIPDNDLSFFRELLKKFKYEEIESGDKLTLSREQHEFVQDLKDGMAEISLHQSGKKKLKTAKELWNEL